MSNEDEARILQALDNNAIALHLDGVGVSPATSSATPRQHSPLAAQSLATVFGLAIAILSTSYEPDVKDIDSNDG